MHITFEQLRDEHLALLLVWLETPHVKEWWDQDVKYTPSLVKEKFGKYIYESKNLDGLPYTTYAYIIYIDQIPIGYIQFYQGIGSVQDKNLNIVIPKRLAGCDMFIGDERYIDKGLGPKILIKFLNEHVDPYFDACLVDPDRSNLRAVKMYEKAGFIKLDESDSTKGDKNTLWMLRESKAKSLKP